jgi:hypothetical protein
MCGAELSAPSELGGRRRVYCSNACRQRAKRQRENRLSHSPGLVNCQGCGSLHCKMTCSCWNKAIDQLEFDRGDQK